MSAREFEEWRAIERIEPFADEWDHTRAIAAAAIAPYSKRKVDLNKFFPNNKARKSTAENEAALHRFAARHNAKVERNAKRKGK